VSEPDRPWSHRAEGIMNFDLLREIKKIWRSNRFEKQKKAEKLKLQLIKNGDDEPKAAAFTRRSVTSVHLVIFNWRAGG